MCACMPVSMQHALTQARGVHILMDACAPVYASASAGTQERHTNRQAVAHSVHVCACVCGLVHVYVPMLCMCVRGYVCMQGFLYAHVCLCVSLCTWIHTYIHNFAHIRLHMLVWIKLSVCECVCVYICIYIYIIPLCTYICFHSFEIQHSKKHTLTQRRTCAYLYSYMFPPKQVRCVRPECCGKASCHHHSFAAVSLLLIVLLKSTGRCKSDSVS